MSLCKEVQWTHENEWEFLEKEKKKKNKMYNTRKYTMRGRGKGNKS